MFVNWYLHHRHVCLTELFGMTLPVFFRNANFFPYSSPLGFLLPLPNSFFSECVSTHFATALKLLLRLTTSAILGKANSYKSTLTCVAAGMTYLCKSWTGVPPMSCEFAPNSIPRCRSKTLQNGISTCLEGNIL